MNVLSLLSPPRPLPRFFTFLAFEWKIQSCICWVLEWWASGSCIIHIHSKIEYEMEYEMECKSTSGDKYEAVPIFVFRMVSGPNSQFVGHIHIKNWGSKNWSLLFWKEATELWYCFAYFVFWPWCGPFQKIGLQLLHLLQDRYGADTHTSFHSNLAYWVS